MRSLTISNPLTLFADFLSHAWSRFFFLFVYVMIPPQPLSDLKSWFEITCSLYKLRIDICLDSIGVATVNSVWGFDFAAAAEEKDLIPTLSDRPTPRNVADRFFSGTSGTGDQRGWPGVMGFSYSKYSKLTYVLVPLCRVPRAKGSMEVTYRSL